MVHRYFDRYRKQLVPLIGEQAASIGVAFYRWLLCLVLAAVLLVGFGVVAGTISLAVGTVGVVACLVLMIIAAVRAGVLSDRGGDLAAEYLSREFGHSVRNHGMKVSIRWWKDLVDAQGVTRKDKFWHVQ